VKHARAYYLQSPFHQRLSTRCCLLPYPAENHGSPVSPEASRLQGDIAVRDRHLDLDLDCEIFHVRLVSIGSRAVDLLSLTNSLDH
jgi:hypothetical protein